MQSERLRRATDDQLELFKQVFSDNLELLKTIRKAFLQMSLSQNEKDSLTYSFKDSEPLKKAVRMMFLPELDGDMPLGQNMDLWMSIEISDKTPEGAHYFIKARKVLIELIEDGLLSLIQPVKGDKITSFTPTEDQEADYIWLMARNSFVSHVDLVLNQIKFLAGKKSETVAETKERLAKDSNK